MTTTRREFVERMAIGAAMAGGIPLSIKPGSNNPELKNTAADEWNLEWPNQLTGKHKAVFDAAGVEGGAGVWRAMMWGKQYQRFLSATPADLSSVVVLRHDAIILAMQQDFWDKYQIGKEKKVLDFNDKPTDKNPAVAILEELIKAGTIALACNMAFADCVNLVKKKENVSEEEARKLAIAQIVPGVILQPSGIFAVVRAQEAGCVYVRAS
jgi:intracellular sulfur oxidation DsrE/DsrF family protein